MQGNFGDCILIANEHLLEYTETDLEQTHIGSNHQIRTISGAKVDEQDDSDSRKVSDIDILEVMKRHWDQLKALVLNAKHFSSRLIDFNGNPSHCQESFKIQNDSLTLAMQKHSVSVARAIQRNYEASDWMTFLEQEENLLNRLFELCLEHLNRITLKINQNGEKTKEFIELAERVDSLLPPVDGKVKNEDRFNHSSPLKSIVKMIGYQLFRRLYCLPESFEEIIADVTTSLRDLNKIRNEPWELSSFKPEQLLDRIEKFLRTIKSVALEADRTKANPLRLDIEVPDDSRDQAFLMLAEKTVENFRSYHDVRQQSIKKSVRKLYPKATVTRSKFEPNNEFYTRYVVLLPFTKLSEWRNWFTSASSIVQKFSEVFCPKEDFTVIPVINDKYGVAYRWEHRLETMRSECIEKTEEISLELNRFLFPNEIIFQDVDYSPYVPSLTIYEDFISLCGVKGFVVGQYDGSHNLDKEFEVHNKAVSALRDSYTEIQPIVGKVNNKALSIFCQFVEQGLNGSDITNGFLETIDLKQLVAGFAEVIWIKSSK